ncbi:hypothetical protein [Anaerosporobacter sp.]
MAKITKEQKLYLEGMAHALQIANKEGIEGLTREVNYRGANNLPLNVKSTELTAIARMRSKEELMIIATAMADTMNTDMKLPPSVVLDFLRKFNSKVDIFRYDKVALEKTQAKLDSMYALNETIKRFNEEE